jgi:hypothetical protein
VILASLHLYVYSFLNGTAKSCSPSITNFSVDGIVFGLCQTAYPTPIPAPAVAVAVNPPIKIAFLRLCAFSQFV